MKGGEVINKKLDFSAEDFEYRLQLIINGYSQTEGVSIPTMIKILKDKIVDLELMLKVKKGLHKN